MRRLAKMAWDEYRITRQFSTGNGEPWCYEPNPPGWFVKFELGFGLGQGPSILMEQQRMREGDRTLRLIDRKYGKGARRAGKLH